MTSEEMAAWVSAIGGLLAIVATGSIYGLDHLKQRKARERARKERAATETRRRKKSAWKQAVLAYPIILRGKQQIEAIQPRLAFGKGKVEHTTVDATVASIYSVPGLNRLAKVLDDTGAFDEETEDALLSYLSIGHHLDEELRRGVQHATDGWYSIRALFELFEPTINPLMNTVKENAEVALRDLEKLLDRKFPRPTREALDAEKYPVVDDDGYDE